MLERLFPCAAIGFLLAACTTSAPAHAPADAPPSAEPPRAGRLAPAPGRRVGRHEVESLELEMHGVRASDGAALEGYALLDDLSEADAICVAAQPDDANHHWAELRILEALVSRARTSGRELALGMQAFQQPAQPALNHYLSEHRPDDRTLLRETEWRTRWQHDFNLYRPLLGTSHRHRVQVIALEAPQELTRKVARRGLRSLDDEERRQLPGLELHDAEHRALFDETPGDYRRGDRKDHRYAARVVSEETRAQAAAAWLRERQPARQLLILAGADRCRRPAVVARLQRRLDCRVVTVSPVLENTGADLEALLREYDYALVLAKRR